jgi:hypothetical protein
MARELLLHKGTVLNLVLQAEGQAKPSFLAYHLEALHRDGPNCPNTPEDIKGAAGVMYGAAADTVIFKIVDHTTSNLCHARLGHPYPSFS